MLSDDIESGVGTGVRMTGNVIRGLIKGLIIGAALAVAGGALVGAVVAAHAMAGAGVLAMAGAAATGAVTGAASMLGMGGGLAAWTGKAMWAAGPTFGPALIGTAAKMGAVILGAASIIPGIKELTAGSKKALTSPQEDIYAPSREQSRGRTAEFENPYYEQGRGARLAARGDSAQQSQYR